MEYIPGVCNIGKKEINARKSIGILFLIASIAFATICILAKLPVLVRIFLFPFLFVSVLSFVQVKLKFCAQYGLFGVFNFTNKLGTTTSIEKSLAKIDKIKSIKIILISLCVSSFVVFLFLLI